MFSRFQSICTSFVFVLTLGLVCLSVADEPSEHPTPRREEAQTIDLQFSAEEQAGVSPFKVQIVFFRTPERVKSWVIDTLVPTLREWRPKLVKQLHTEGNQTPQECRIVFCPGKGVAYTSGTTIVCQLPWFDRNMNGEALGAFVHELTHFVQQYPGGNPSWLVEGLTDYIRWFQFEPKPIVYIDFRRAKYTDSYRTTAAFLNYVVKNRDPEIIEKLNQVMREGKYSDAVWQEWTGKTAEELWSEFRQSKTASPEPRT